MVRSLKEKYSFFKPIQKCYGSFKNYCFVNSSSNMANHMIGSAVKTIL